MKTFLALSLSIFLMSCNEQSSPQSASASNASIEIRPDPVFTFRVISRANGSQIAGDIIVNWADADQIETGTGLMTFPNGLVQDFESQGRSTLTQFALQSAGEIEIQFLIDGQIADDQILTVPGTSVFFRYNIVN